MTSDNLAHAIGLRVKRWRLKKFKSAAAAARAWGRARSEWSELEAGSRLPGLDRLQEVAKLLDCRLVDLVADPDRTIVSEAVSEYTFDGTHDLVEIRLKTPVDLPAGAVLIARVHRVDYPKDLDQADGSK